MSKDEEPTQLSGETIPERYPTGGEAQPQPNPCRSQGSLAQRLVSGVLPACMRLRIPLETACVGGWSQATRQLSRSICRIAAVGLNVGSPVQLYPQAASTGSKSAGLEMSGHLASRSSGRHSHPKSLPLAIILRTRRVSGVHNLSTIGQGTEAKTSGVAVSRADEQTRAAN
jgi:hypothetical protein